MTDLTSDVTLDGVPATAPELAADTPIMAFAQLQLAAPLAKNGYGKYLLGLLK